MSVTKPWLAVLGALFVLYSMWLFVRQASREGWDKGKDKGWVLIVYVAGMGLFFWLGRDWLLGLYGVFALAWAGYYIGRAIINHAHSELRPHESDRRRQLYTVVEVAVFIGISWLIGEIVGVDWRDFFATSP